MAENYLQFSEVIPGLGVDEETWLKDQLQSISVRGEEEIPINDLDSRAVEGADWYGPRFLRDYDDFDFESDTLGFEFRFHQDDEPNGWGRHLWMYADEHGDPNHVAWLVRKFLKRFRPERCWSLSYATTCSKLRVGEFSGGAMFVTADEVCWENAYDFVEDRRKAFETQRPQINRLIRRAKACGLQPEQLDEVVHETASSVAASLNNAGLDEQIAYLVKEFGPEETERMIDEAAGLHDVGGLKT